MKIIAHRGASHDAPENTLAAVRLAWDQQADGVEVDVHVSRDGHIMVIHDPNTRRTAGRRSMVSALSLDELRRLDAGKWKSQRWAGEPIPTLNDVVETIPPAKELLIEVKCGHEFLGPFERLERSARSHELVLIGFDLALMRQAKKHFPHRRVLWVTALDRRYNWDRPRGALDALMNRVRDAGLDGVDLDARGPITENVAERIRAAGLEIYVWTVDSVAQARRFARIGITGLTTNKCALVRQALTTLPPAP